MRSNTMMLNERWNLASTEPHHVLQIIAGSPFTLPIAHCERFQNTIECD